MYSYVHIYNADWIVAYSREQKIRREKEILCWNSEDSIRIVHCLDDINS